MGKRFGMSVDGDADRRLNELKRNLGVLTDEELLSRMVALTEALVKRAGASSIITISDVSGIGTKIDLRGSAR